MSMWFGRPPLPGAIMAWGARAIFRPQMEGFPLDLLHDRQGWHKEGGVTDEDAKKFQDLLNEVVLPRLQKIATYFSTSDSGSFIRHFDWPGYPDSVVVANGSPQGSYGYFYLGVSVLPRHLAPPETGPDGLKSAWEAMRERERALNTPKPRRRRARMELP